MLIASNSIEVAQQSTTKPRIRRKTVMVSNAKSIRFLLLQEGINVFIWEPTLDRTGVIDRLDHEAIDFCRMPTLVPDGVEVSLMV